MIVMAVLEKACYYKLVSNGYMCMIVMAVLEKPCYYKICVLIKMSAICGHISHLHILVASEKDITLWRT